MARAGFVFRLLKPCAVAAFLAVLAACGGGGGGGEGGATPPPPDNLPPTTGPGDPLNYVPIAVGDAWTYNGMVSDAAISTPQRDLARVWVNGTATVKGQEVTVFSERMFSEPATAPTYDLYYQKGPGGVAFYGNNDPGDTLTNGAVPYAELLFPVQVGPIVSFSKTGLDLGEDLDGDGKKETVEATSTISIAAFEPITVPAGTFASAAKRVNTIVANTKMSASGQTVVVTTTETAWLAPGAGLVRRDTVATAAGITYRATGSIEARGYTVGGVHRGLGNPVEIAPSTLGPLTQTDASTPDPVDSPAVASSGGSFLVLAKSYVPDSTNKLLLTRKAFLRSPDGALALSFDLGAPVLSNDTRESQFLVYGAGTYLAVFEQRDPVAPNVTGITQPSIVAQRISPTGALTDAVPFVLLPPGPAPMMPGVNSRLPHVAYGGGRFLVVYCGGSGTTGMTYIEGRLVGPDGVAGAPFRISPDFVFNGRAPRVAFDGTHFVVATPDVLGWRLARVTTAGTVLDPSGVATPLPAQPVQIASSGAGGVLVAWMDGTMPKARRFGPDLAALDGASIAVAMGSGGNSGLNVGFFGGEYVVSWTQRYGMPTDLLVVYMNRVGTDGKVQAQSTPVGGLPSTVPYAALVTPVPPMPPYGYIGGYALPVLGTGPEVALLAYVSGTSTAYTFNERAMGLQGIWVHPFGK